MSDGAGRIRTPKEVRARVRAIKKVAATDAEHATSLERELYVDMLTLAKLGDYMSTEFSEMAAEALKTQRMKFNRGY